jgi:hypothetical protein
MCRKGMLVWQDAVAMFWENDINNPVLQERTEVAKYFFEQGLHRMVAVSSSKP